MNIKELMAKTKNFVKKHKKVIIITAVALGGTIIGCVMKKKLDKDGVIVLSPGRNVDESSRSEFTSIDGSNWSVGELSEGTVKKIGGRVIENNFVLDKLKRSDLGKLGEELSKLEGVNEDSNVYLWVCVNNADNVN